MRAIITAGGTGGHIYPALAIYDKIMEMEPDSKILYIGTTDRMEKDIVPNKNIDYIGLEVYGISRSLSLKNIKSIICYLKAIRKSKKILKDFKPDIVIGVGGYISAPVLKAAHKLNIKTVIHEQNSFFGLANKVLLNKADLIFTSFPDTINYALKYKYKVIYTGNPCSEAALIKKVRNKEELGFSTSKKLIMILMGSLGSKVVNDKMKKIILKFKNKSYEVLFVTGKDYYDEFKDIKIDNVRIFPFIEDIVRVMKDTDLVVSRAGATTISEIVSLSIPSILVPSPYVADNHQYKNAMDLVNENAAILLEEKHIEELVENIDKVINDTNKLNELKTNLSKFKVNNSSTTIYENIKKLIGEQYEYNK